MTKPTVWLHNALATCLAINLNTLDEALVRDRPPYLTKRVNIGSINQNTTRTAEDHQNAHSKQSKMCNLSEGHLHIAVFCSVIIINANIIMIVNI